MRTEFICDICGERAGTLLSSRRYSAARISDADIYHGKRLRVLFDVWCAGMPEVTFTAVMCNACGFVSHLPRAESRDVHAKYVALCEWGQDYGRGDTGDFIEQRSRDLFIALKPAVTLNSPMNILDFGGGDGRLMSAFSQAGHRTFLVDYNNSPVDGVQKLSDTLDGLDPGMSFDLIVANYVLEHVAEPTVTLRRLSRHIRPGGFLFVEVPMEIWGGAPLHDEPVTHVNFFVQGSLRRCFEEAGLEVIFCRLARTRYSSGIRLSVQALGMRSHNVPRPKATGARQVKAFLSPSIGHRIRRRLIIDGGIVSTLRHTARRYHAR